MQQISMLRERLRQAAPELMKELEATELAIESLNPGSKSSEFSGYRRAIESYLHKNGARVTGRKLTEAIVKGGWRSQDKRAVYNVKDSIRYHLKHPETGKICLLSGSLQDIDEAEIGLQSSNRFPSNSDLSSTIEAENHHA